MKIRITAKGASRLLARHPWVYRSDLIDSPQQAGLCTVYGPKGFLALALYSPLSEIALRAYSYSQGDLQESLWRNLDAALARRQKAWLQQPQGAFRLAHAEGDFLPGLVIDSYAGHAVLQAGAAAWEGLLPQVAQRLVQWGVQSVLAKNDPKARELEGLERYVKALAGEVPDSVWVQEGRVTYRVDLLEGQKTGAFIDQRDNRIWLEGLQGQNALDVFSYHGSFALHMAGFAQVTAVDSSAAALQRAQENAQANRLNLQTLEANAFEYLRQQERQRQKFDLIVLDPPALAKSKRDLVRAYAAYKELNLRAIKLLAPQGILLSASCSHHLSEPMFYQMLAEAAADAHQSLQVVEKRSQGWDHPVLLGVPETHYLKLAILQAR